MPALEDLGARFRELEESARQPVTARIPRRRLPSWRWRLIPVAAVAAVVGVLEVVAPAGASSPVNRAPAAAIKTGSVRFRSSVRASLNGRPLTTIRESGGLNFATGDYVTTVSLPEAGVRVERRRLAGALYLTETTATRPRSKWIAFRTASGHPLPTEPLTLLDPQVIFTVLEDARAPTVLVGREKIAGVRVLHYRVHTTLAAFLAAEALPSAMARIYRPTEAILDVWLDPAGRPLRVTAAFAVMRKSGLAKMEATTEFDGYGDPVSIPVPSRLTAGLGSATARTAVIGDSVYVFQRILFAAE